MKRSLALAVISLIGVGLPFSARGEVLKWNAADLFEHSVTQNLRLIPDRGDLCLDTGELFEDDGPAAGHSYQLPKNTERLSATTWVKKELIMPHPQAKAAYLIVLSEEPFETVINGILQKKGPNLSGRSAYKTYAFDPKILKTGSNEIILRNSGTVPIAREDEFILGSRTRQHHPNRSAKSMDGGKTWDDNHLGPDGQLDGEYGVRVFLDHHLAHGELTSAVIDTGGLASENIGRSIKGAGPIDIAVDAEAGSHGTIRVRARTSPSYSLSASDWSAWQELDFPRGRIERPVGRYLQIALELSTSDPLSTPLIHHLQVVIHPKPGADWTSRLHVLEAHDEQIIRTAIPFEYEPLNEPRLGRLRQEFGLDQIVQGASTELDLMLRLAQWACDRWDWPNHITEQYPPWDALEILKPFHDGTPLGGFCQQFNLVFLQACESFGFNGRALSISQGRLQESRPGGGHEIVELWSNEWKKWVYVDGALAWYVVDDQTATPLSMLELRERQLALLQGRPSPAVRVVAANRTKNQQFKWNGLFPDPLNWYAELRLIPRSNFLEQTSPLPLNQGTEEWAWTGSFVWTDDIVPAGLLFGHRISKRQDFEWTLNQAHYHLEAQNRPGLFRVHADTETPSFDTLLAEVDEGAKTSVRSGFEWTLHPGKNRLRIRPRNSAGREGIPSWVSLEYK